VLEFGHNNQVEDYLDRTCSPMIGQKPYEERAAIREELRSHVLAAIEASKELGASDSEAVAAALKMVGKPEQVSRSFGVRKKVQWGRFFFAASVVLFAGSLWVSRPQVQPAPKPDTKGIVAGMPSGGIRDMHVKWTAQHACTECHRASVTSWVLLDGSDTFVSRQR